ncbi:Glycosyl transferases group 1 [Aliiroseovarius crassostreae]|uniref:Glycosyl transferase family 1 domain-containing protein n=2 Tax=Aliiroseovarius crassostreae TaxID=154981 RepID=A0A0P7ISP8_9RHOB|nr:hypothetical protein AKJ29_04330 [Aliiroseovarius crassostreae]SFU47560.1 Glycosyl transferases group 1 [Aliiroseovarius crassostreae]
MPQCDFIIYGMGVDQDWLTAEADKRRNVSFLGATRDVKSALRKIDIFLMTSDFEGFPISVVEALSQAVPVVIGKNSFANARVLIKDGYNGFVGETFDPEVVAGLIEKVQGQYETFSINSLKQFENFSPAAFKARWKEIFDEVTDNATGSEC